MKASIRVQSYNPRCTCGTKPGTSAWERHIIDLFGMEEKARICGNPDLIREITALVEAHLAMEG